MSESPRFNCTDEPLIEVLGLHKTFAGVRAVDDVRFSVRRGRVCGLLGANGAGKTTCLRLIAGTLLADCGVCTIDGHDLSRSPPRYRLSLGYLPETPSGYPEMSVEGFLRFRGELCLVAREAVCEAIERVIGDCDLRSVARRRIGTLSKGYRQRVGLAAALLHDPPVLLLDEPATGLDPVQLRDMRALVRELGRNKAVLLSSHLLSEVERTCDEVVVLAGGRVQAASAIGEGVDLEALFEEALDTAGRGTA